MRSPSILLLLSSAATLAACSGMNRGGEWPTLAPRPGELSPMVPRTALTTPNPACAGCGQDVFTTAETPAPPQLLPAPSDAPARLAAIDKAIAGVEAALPAQQRITAAAITAANGQPADSNPAIQAQVEISRLESLFLPLATQSKALDALEDDLAGRADTDALTTRAAALRARLDSLESARLR